MMILPLCRESWRSGFEAEDVDDHGSMKAGGCKAIGQLKLTAIAPAGNPTELHEQVHVLIGRRGVVHHVMPEESELLLLPLLRSVSHVGGGLHVMNRHEPRGEGEPA